MATREEEAERRIAEARELRLESLDLGDLALQELPASLAKLPHLKALYLASANEAGWLMSYSGRERPRFRTLSVLSSLTGLRHLDLTEADVTDLSGLSSLAALQSLSVWNTQVKDLLPLSGLANLQSLDLSGTNVTDLSALSTLASLQSLDLRNMEVTDLSALSGLVGLQGLRLTGTDVKDLSALSGLVGLQFLNLGHTGVTNLSVFSSLTGLQALYVFGCQISTPKSLVGDIVDHPRLEEFRASKIASVPKEVLSSNSEDNCLPRLRSWYSEVRTAGEAENEVKIVPLGNGRIGKTQLCRRFRNETFDATIESTHGVQRWRQALTLDVAGSSQTFSANWWDFGGQDIYHGTHALFLRSRAVFLLLWNPAFENNNESNEDGVPVRNQPLAYWLDYVRSLAGADSPVIVVQSQCDEHGDRCPDPARQEGFGFFETCAYSSRTNRGRETLESHLREAIRYLLDRTGALMIGRGRAEVRRRLYAWRDDDQALVSHMRRHRTLTRAAFRALCDEVGDIVSWEHALDYFHQTGVVFHHRDLFEDCIILDQDWALDAVYAVFHRGRAVPLLRDSGRFTQADLAALVWHTHSAEEQALFLGLMESCGVCFPCGVTGRGEKRYIAADLLPAFDGVQLPAWDDEADITTLQFDYRFFHPAIVRDLMRDIVSLAGELATYWKYGFWFKDGKRNAQLRMRFVDSSTAEFPGAGLLVLEAQGRNPLALLAEIHRSVLQRRIGESPDECLTIAGATVARSALDTIHDGRVLTLDKTWVPAGPFAAFFTGKEYVVTMDIEPQPVAATDKRPEIYISYAWGDDSPEGRVRAQAVDTLQMSLASDGYAPVRDRDSMRTGDRISSFMSRLTHADRIVALISDKYLRSYYCMYEFYRLWQRAQTDADQLLETLVPVVLPDVRVGSFADRAPYLRYWSEKARDADAAFADRDLAWSKQSWEEARLVREFAHHVDEILVFLNDVLMPRRIETHLDDGFQAVRDVLRRR